MSYFYIYQAYFGWLITNELNKQDKKSQPELDLNFPAIFKKINRGERIKK